MINRESQKMGYHMFGFHGWLVTNHRWDEYGQQRGQEHGILFVDDTGKAMVDGHSDGGHWWKPWLPVVDGYDWSDPIQWSRLLTIMFEFDNCPMISSGC